MKRIILALIALGVAVSPASAQMARNPSTLPIATAVAASSLTVPRQSTQGVQLFAWRVTTGASAGYVMLFDGAAPADGVVSPLDCLPVAATTGVGASLSQPERFNTSLTVVFSTTGCFTKTASATAYIRVVAQ